MEVNPDGEIRYYNNQKLLHRDDGPALIIPDQREEYYLNGILHRVDGPALIIFGEKQEYYINGILHREDGPAVVYDDGGKTFYLNGKLESFDGNPGHVAYNGNKFWYREGNLHRSGGLPAIIRVDSKFEKEFWVDGKRISA